MSTETFPIVFEDAAGKQWRRKRITRSILREIEAKETQLQEVFDAEVARVEEANKNKKEDEKPETVSGSKFLDVRFSVIASYVADVDGNALTTEDVDLGEAQHLFQGFWRSVWGLDPKGNLL